MNIFKKLTLAALILGAGAQTINAHPWTTKAIAVATLAGLGLGAGTVKYYGFNTVTNAVLEKCANAKNWFSTKLSDIVYGSYKKQLQKERNAKTAYLEKQAEEKAILIAETRDAIAQQKAQLAAKEAEYTDAIAKYEAKLAEKNALEKDAQIRAINLTKENMALKEKENEIKRKKDEHKEFLNEEIDRLYVKIKQGESKIKRSQDDKETALIETTRLQVELTNQQQIIAELKEALTQAKLALAASSVPSDEFTSESLVATTDAEETPAVNQ